MLVEESVKILTSPIYLLPTLTGPLNSFKLLKNMLRITPRLTKAFKTTTSKLQLTGSYRAFSAEPINQDWSEGEAAMDGEVHLLEEILKDPNRF